MYRVSLVYHEINTKDNFMSVRLEDFIKQIEYLKKKKFRFEHLGKFKDRTILITFDDALKSIKPAVEYLEKNKIKYSIAIITNHLDSEDMLDVAFLESLKYAEFLFHTRSHKSLENLSDKELEQELTIPTVNINLRPDTIVYPMGLYNDRVIQSVSKKFTYGLAIDPYHYTNQSLLTIPRICISDNLSFFKFKFLMSKLGNIYLHLAVIKRKMLKQNPLK